MNEQVKPTDAELDILRVLWQHGPGTVRQIHEQLPDNPPRGYTTVLKLLQIMAEKGLVERDEAQRAHVYRAAMSPDQTRGNLLKHLLEKAFDNSTSKLVAHILAATPASPEELAEIRRLLDEKEGEKK